jgi:hypothetical protein
MTIGLTRCVRSIVVDSKCDLLLYGNAERAVVEIAHRLAAREPVHDIIDVRGTAFVRRQTPEGWFEIDSSSVDTPGHVEAHVNPYLMISEQARENGATCAREDEAQSVADQQNASVKPLKFVPNPQLPAMRAKACTKCLPVTKVSFDCPVMSKSNQIQFCMRMPIECCT